MTPPIEVTGCGDCSLCHWTFEYDGCDPYCCRLDRQPILIQGREDDSTPILITPDNCPLKVEALLIMRKR